MRFNGLKSHLRLQKLRFLDAPGLFLLEIVLTGAYDLADVLANVLVLKWMIGALMGRDLIRAAWVLGGFLVYQLSVSFLWHWYFERIYPQWKERLEYKLNCRLYRIMLDADCRKYNEESYFHGYRRALQFTQTKMEETLEFYRQLFGSFLAGAVAVVIYIRMDQMIVVFVLLAFVASRFCVKSLVEKTNAKRDEQNKKDALHQNYLRIFLRKEYAAEGRILGCLPFFVKRDQDSFSQKAEQTKQWNRRIFPIAFGREIGSDFLFIDCLMIAYLGYCFFWKKTIGLDDFAALLNGTHIILYALSVLFEQMAGRAGEYAGYIDGFIDFCEQNGEQKPGIHGSGQQDDFRDFDGACRFRIRGEESLTGYLFSDEKGRKDRSGRRQWRWKNDVHQGFARTWKNGQWDDFCGWSSRFNEGRMGGMPEAFYGAVCRKSAVCGVFGGECGAFRKRR